MSYLLALVVVCLRSWFRLKGCEWDFSFAQRRFGGGERFKGFFLCLLWCAQREAQLGASLGKEEQQPQRLDLLRTTWSWEFSCPLPLGATSQHGAAHPCPRASSPAP